MKKISELLKPYLSIILGALLLLVYLNWLSYQEWALALGIIAVVMAAYYIAAGIIGIVLGEKLPKGLKLALDITSICFFPVFMFVYFLLLTINGHDALGPTGWAIIIISMVASLALPCAYAVSKFVKNGLLGKLCFLFAAVFILALLLNVLFAFNGDPIVLGNINIISVVIYFVYGYMLMNSLLKPEAK